MTIKAKRREDVPELESIFQFTESTFGFVPNSMLLMAHWPKLLKGFAGLGSVISGDGEIDPELKKLLGFVVSNASGCTYCQAHTSFAAKKIGTDVNKIQHAFEFETSELFTAAERAALRVALHAGMVPNAVEEHHMEELKSYFTDRQCVEIVAVISLFGFLNRWNDTMATTLEDKPKSFAEESIAGKGWQLGKHD